MPKSVLTFLLVAILLLTGLGNSCSFVQYSDNARKVLPATVRIIAGDSLGSGVVVGKAGLVLTSNHVIADSKIAEVIFVDGAKYQGRSLLTDAGKDLALIQIENNGVAFPCANLGNSAESDELQTGDNVEIVGYPAFTESEAPAVTSGRISGFPRIESVQFIQTCAHVYPGNSGGPVINRFGEVIGIVNGKYSNVEDSCATFATAISEAEDLIARVNDQGQLDPGRDKGSINKPVVTQTVCPNAGCTAPDFTLQSLDGKSISLRSLKGKKALLIFAGTGCPACSQVMQCVSPVYAAWPRGLLETLVIISREKSSNMELWAKENNVKCPVLPDPAGEVYNLYQPAGLPAMYFINTYGDIKIKRTIHFDKCAAEVDALLRLY